MKASLNIYLPNGKVSFPIEIDDEILAECETAEEREEYMQEVCDEMTLTLLERNVTATEEQP